MRREPLSELRVVNQCPASWDGMAGNERVRHCSQCNLNVFNISDMSHAEAVDLVKQTEGRVCVRYYQRTDGTILTRDCSVRDRLSLGIRLKVAAICGVVGITMSTGCMGSTGPDHADNAPATKAKVGSPER